MTPSLPRRHPWLALRSCCLLLTLLYSLLSAGCVIDRTGQSKSLGLQQDLALTHTQVQSLQRQVDDQLAMATTRLVEAQETAQLSRRSQADSGALVSNILAEMQGLRGVFDEMNVRADATDRRSQRVQEDVEFRLLELEKRLTALETAMAALQAAPTAPSATSSTPAEPEENGEKLSPEERVARAKTYFEAGNYKIVLAFLKGFPERFPTSPAREEAIFLYAEALLKEGSPAAALQEYQRLLEGFPRSPRIPTVMLRQGECLVAMGEKEDAQIFFSELIKAFPRAPEAEQARARLKELKP